MDKFDRHPGETDAELRVRLIDTPIIKEARNAIWRVYGMKNKDKIQATIMINGKIIAMTGDVSYSHNINPIDVLGKFEIEEIVPK